jgi:hypothetical protein
VLVRDVQVRDALGLPALRIDQQQIALIAGLAVNGGEEARAARDQRAGNGRSVGAARDTPKGIARVG